MNTESYQMSMRYFDRKSGICTQPKSATTSRVSLYARVPYLHLKTSRHSQLIGLIVSLSTAYFEWNLQRALCA